MADTQSLFDAARSGDARSLGRALSVLEEDDESARELDRLSLQQANDGYVVGVTGPPGAGKSSLVDLLVGTAEGESKERIAVVAVDPTSPFSGGAILGDRVRMQHHGFDDNVFIRSLASRGLAGGLSLSARRAIRLFLACGYKYVFVETVGVGQIELDIASAADTVVVVVVPNAGDEVQAAKAGILEIANVFAVNKADLPGADQIVRDLVHELELTGSSAPPKVIATSATEATGIEELWAAIDEHRAHLVESGELRSQRSSQRIDEMLIRATDNMREHLYLRISEELADKVKSGTIDPASAADELVTMLVKE